MKLTSYKIIKPFKPIQPDWKQCYYSLAVLVVESFVSLIHGDKNTSIKSLDIATKAINMIESNMRMGNSITIVETLKKDKH